MTFEELKEKAHRLPQLPGVYLMQNRDGVVIYVGKAKSLRNRVSQYFSDLASHTLKTRRLVANIHHFETIFANSELDALLLENTLIKKYKPKYNILLKDDKGYPFIRISREDYPRLSVAGRREKDGAQYFGPYGGRGTANTAIRLLSETFLLPSCSRRFPRDIGKERPCLQLHMKKCCGLCTGTLSAQAYQEIIRQCIQVLEGKSEELEGRLQQQMEQAAEELRFEDAAKIRDMGLKIRRLESAAKSITTTTVEVRVPVVDSVVVLDTVRLFCWRDSWVTVEGKIAQDSVECKVHSVDTLKQIVYRVPRKFLFFRFGTKAIKQHIVSSNPHTEVVYTEYIKIGKR